MVLSALWPDGFRRLNVDSGATHSSYRYSTRHRRQRSRHEVPVDGLLGRRAPQRRGRAGARRKPSDDEDEGFPWLNDLQARGIWIIGDRLAPTRRARSVRHRGGTSVITDGPFVETKEAVGGFDIIECGSMEEAVEIASNHPVAQFGTIEVRPFWGK